MQFYSYGSIVVVDAVTMLRKKVFRFEDLLEQKPEGSLDSLDMLPLNTPLENLAIIDEHSLFLADGQGMFRPDTETGVLTLVKGELPLRQPGADDRYRGGDARHDGHW